MEIGHLCPLFIFIQQREEELVKKRKIDNEHFSGYLKNELMFRIT